MSTSKIFSKLPILFTVTLCIVGGVFSCVKKDNLNSHEKITYTDNDFFLRANGNLGKIEVLEKTIERFDKLDEKQHFANELKSKYGDLEWGLSIVLKNKDSLYTLVTPFIKYDSVIALSFSYHVNPHKTIYRIFNRKNYKKNFKKDEGPNDYSLNISIIEGFFDIFKKNYLIKKMYNGRTIPRTTIISTCWRYFWTGGNGDIPTVGVTTWKCSYQIIDEGSGSGDGTRDQYCPDCGAGGGGGGEVYIYEEKQSPNQNIIDSLQGYPCAQNLLGKIGNLNDSISKLIHATFGSSEDFNLIFVPRSGMGLTAGQTLVNSGTQNIWNSKIALNSDDLQNATQEYILITMYHEALHAYLGYQSVQLGDSAFNSKYPKIKTYDVVSSNGKKTKRFDLLDDHERFGAFINLLEQSIKSFNPNMPSDRVTAMARMGIIDPSAITNEQKLLNGYERNVNDGNSVGTKCPTQSN